MSRKNKLARKGSATAAGKVARMTGRATAAAASVVLAGTLGAGQALAYDQAQLTIRAKDNAEPAYLAYELFAADIEPAQGATGGNGDGGGTASHVSWANGAKETVLSYLYANGYDEWLVAEGHVAPGAAEIAQNAAEYCADMIGASADDPSAATAPATKKGASFVSGLARAVAAAGIDPVKSQPADGGATIESEEGFYLVVSDTASVGFDEAATAPIWVPLGGSTTEIVEKTSAPAVQKLVRENATGAWGKAADGAKGQDLAYRITAVMPANIAAFDTYELEFEDTLPAGMQPASGDTSSVRVKIEPAEGEARNLAGKDGVSIAWDAAAGVLSVKVQDARALGAHAGDTMAVEYEAHLTEDAVIGAEGNVNDVTVTYPTDPARATAARGSTAPGAHQTRTYTFQLDVEKIGKATGESLPGTKFTVQADPDGPDAQVAGKYVQADGSLANEPFAFETGSDGHFNAPRIDAGTYYIREVQAPDGYELQDSDIEVRLAPAYSATTGEFESWDVSVSGGETAGERVTRLVSAGEGGIEAQSVSGGVVKVQTPDDESPTVPVTGQGGVAGIAIGAGVALAVSAGALGGRRRDEVGGVGGVGGAQAADQ